jgi:hypothetical protein
MHFRFFSITFTLFFAFGLLWERERSIYSIYSTGMDASEQNEGGNDEIKRLLSFPLVSPSLSRVSPAFYQQASKSSEFSLDAADVRRIELHAHAMLWEQRGHDEKCRRGRERRFIGFVPGEALSLVF